MLFERGVTEDRIFLCIDSQAVKCEDKTEFVEHKNVEEFQQICYEFENGSLTNYKMTSKYNHWKLKAGTNERKFRMAKTCLPGGLVKMKCHLLNTEP